MVSQTWSKFLLSLCVLASANAQGDWGPLEDENQLSDIFIKHSDLVDPFSTQFRGVKVNEQYNDNENIVMTICGQVNAKNRMGGYVGWSNFYVIDGLENKPIIWMGEGPDYPTLAKSPYDHYCDQDADVFMPFYAEKWNTNFITGNEWTAVTALLRAEPRGSESQEKWLHIACTSSPLVDTLISINWSNEIPFKDSRVYKVNVQFDENKMKRWKLTKSTKNQASAMFDRGGKFLREIFKSKKFTISSGPVDSAVVSLDFDVSDLKKELDELKDACGY